MPLLRIVGSSEIISNILTDGRKNNQIWHVGNGKLGIENQLDALKKILNLDNTENGFEGYGVFTVSGGGKGRQIDLEMSLSQVQSEFGMPVKEIWVDRTAPPPPKPTPPPTPPTTEPPEADPPAEQHEPQPPQPPPAPIPTSPQDSDYEGNNWIPLLVNKEGTVSLSSPHQESFCKTCRKCVMANQNAALWSEVSEFPIPPVENRKFKSDWMQKLSFDRKNTGEWKVKGWADGLGVSWKDRYFAAGPNGLHYYSTQGIEQKDRANAAKNSKVFTPTTVILTDPSPAEFPTIKAGDGYKYLGLRFSSNEALIMRVKSESDKKEWLSFFETTMKQLMKNEVWAAATDPPASKVIIIILWF